MKQCHNRTRSPLGALVLVRGLALGGRPSACASSAASRRSASTATRRRAARSTSSGARASTTAPTSAATSATPPSETIRTPSSTTTRRSRCSSRRRTAALPLEGGRGVRRLAPLQGGRILGSLDNVLAEVVEGNSGMNTPGLPEGQLGRGGQRLLAVPRLAGQGPAGRQARPGDLAEQRHRPDQPGRHRGRLHRLPQPPRVLRRPGAPPEHLRQVPPGPRPPAEGDLRGVEARHRVLRQRRQDEPGQSTKWIVGEDYSVGPDLRDLPHVGDQGPAGHPRHRHADQLEQPAGDVGPPGGVRRQDGPAREGRALADAPRKHEERLPELPQHELGRQLLRPVRRADRALQREVRRSRAWSSTRSPSRC